MDLHHLLDKSQAMPGPGQGVAFVKQVVEIHGGVAGYEATEEGNNFYFILPLPDPNNVPVDQG
jgi:signal transduction histidine kinase